MRTAVTSAELPTPLSETVCQAPTLPATLDATAVHVYPDEASEAAVEGGFVALGMEDSMLPPELLEGHRGMFVVSARRRCH